MISLPYHFYLAIAVLPRVKPHLARLTSSYLALTWEFTQGSFITNQRQQDSQKLVLILTFGAYSHIHVHVMLIVQGNVNVDGGPQ